MGLFPYIFTRTKHISSSFYPCLILCLYPSPDPDDIFLIKCHPYHILDEFPWPLFGSIGGLYFTTEIVS